MNIVIVGTGAIGSLWATHLASQHHNNVSVLPTSHNNAPHSTPIYSITLSHYLGKSEKINIPLATHTQLESADLVLVCLKAYHVVESVREIITTLNKKTVLALCHNGMGTVERIRPFLPQDMTVIAMLTTHGAFRPQKKHTIHTGLGQTDIGLAYGHINAVLKQRITKTLIYALPKVYWQNNLKEKQWLKLAVNCVINPITALHNIKNGQVNTDQFQPLVIKLCDEVVKVAAHEGVNIDQGSLITTVLSVAKQTAANQSSMLCDVLNHQHTEIDYINGYLINMAKKHQLKVPENEQLYSKIKSIEASFRTLNHEA